MFSSTSLHLFTRLSSVLHHSYEIWNSYVSDGSEAAWTEYERKDEGPGARRSSDGTLQGVGQWMRRRSLVVGKQMKGNTGWNPISGMCGGSKEWPVERNNRREQKHRGVFSFCWIKESKKRRWRVVFGPVTSPPKHLPSAWLPGAFVLKGKSQRQSSTYQSVKSRKVNITYPIRFLKSAPLALAQRKTGGQGRACCEPDGASRNTMFSTGCTSLLWLPVCWDPKERAQQCSHVQVTQLFRNCSPLQAPTSWLAVQWTAICGFLSLCTYVPSVKGNGCCTDYRPAMMCPAEHNGLTLLESAGSIFP